MSGLVEISKAVKSENWEPGLREGTEVREGSRGRRVARAAGITAAGMIVGRKIGKIPARRMLERNGVDPADVYTRKIFGEPVSPREWDTAVRASRKVRTGGHIGAAAGLPAGMYANSQHGDVRRKPRKRKVKMKIENEK